MDVFHPSEPAPRGSGASCAGDLSLECLWPTHIAIAGPVRSPGSELQRDSEAMATPLAASSALSLHYMPSHSTLHFAASPPSTSTTARITSLSNLKPRASLVARAGSSSPGSVAEEEKAPSSSGTQGNPGDDGTSEVSTSQPSRAFSPTACQACGKEEKVGGCNGEGRILGGLGSVPGFGWVPIKAYRPCPAFVEAGGRYKRQGQSLEEVAFGRKGKADNLDITERLQGGNKTKK